MLFLAERDVERLLPLHDMFDALKGAFIAQAGGEISMPLRTLAAQPGGVLGAMPAARFGKAPSLGAKLVTFFAGNAREDIPTHNAVIALFDPRTGRPLALLDGRYITEARTAVVSALATAALARAEAAQLAILGTGVQARAHVKALAHVMHIETVHVWGRTHEGSERFAAFARAHGLDVRVAQRAGDAARLADVICTVTSAREPILTRGDVRDGTHINAVGFGGPSARELAGDLVARCRIFIDSPEGAEYESGNLILARRDGHLPAEKFTLLCDVLAGRVPGRQSAHDITLFDSLGIAIEDLACAQLAYDRALHEGVGTQLDL